jgi:threonine aldolase
MTYPVASNSAAADAPTTDGLVDLRSDTVTRPSPGMLAAMTSAPVGDDVWGDDPTVNRLQSVTAERAGKAAGLFFPSGTQSNLAALMSHCARGEEVILGQRAHTYRYEAGGAAVLGSIQPQPIENEADGTLAISKIAAEIKADDAHFARTRLLALENTINGKVLPAAYVAEASALARSKGLALHLDGARAWNAAVAMGASVAQVCAPFDSVSLCFSKGLGAPVGSVLVGPKELIDRAKRARKMLGGGMRQAGILAAGCLYALDHHIEGLAEDHANAQRLADGLAQFEELRVESLATNMLFVRVPEARCAGLQAALAEAGVLAAISPLSRFVLHRDVSAAGVERTIAVIKAHLAN